MRPDGSDKRRLASGSVARWSPDGRRLVFGRHANGHSTLSIYELATRTVTRLTSGTTVDEPAGWSPDGRTILFTRYGSAGDSAIYLVGADGHGLRRLSHGSAETYAASFSPDGTQILFTSRRTGHHQVFAMRTDGTGIRNLSSSSTDDEAVQWHS
jgi:TolB protein